jgi:hypothetical protein
MMKSRLVDANDKESHPSRAIACSRWVAMRCYGHHNPPFFPWNPLLYHLLFFLPIPNSLSPHQKPLSSSSSFSYIYLLLLFIFRCSQNQSWQFSFRITYLVRTAIPPLFLFQYPFTSRHHQIFYSPFLICCYKHFSSLSLTHVHIFLSSTLPYLKEIAKIITIWLQFIAKH